MNRFMVKVDLNVRATVRLDFETGPLAKTSVTIDASIPPDVDAEELEIRVAGFAAGIQRALQNIVRPRGAPAL